MLRLALTALLAVSTAGAAWADCTPAKSDLDDFGAAPLGRVPSDKLYKVASVSSNCNFEGNRVCGFFDWHAIYYEVLLGVTGDEQDSIEAKVIDPWNYRAGRPFGIWPGISREVAIAHFASRFGVTLAPIRGWDGWTTLSSGECLINAKGVKFTLFLKFDPDKLVKLGTTSNSVTANYP